MTNWSAVTLGEYNALAVLRHSDTAALIHDYWRQLHTEHRVIVERTPSAGDVDDEPTRLTDDGIAWLNALRQRATGPDDGDALDAGRELIRGLGLLLVNAVARVVRSS